MKFHFVRAACKTLVVSIGLHRTPLRCTITSALSQTRFIGWAWVALGASPASIPTKQNWPRSSCDSQRCWKSFAITIRLSNLIIKVSSGHRCQRDQTTDITIHHDRGPCLCSILYQLILNQLILHSFIMSLFHLI